MPQTKLQIRLTSHHLAAQCDNATSLIKFQEAAIGAMMVLVGAAAIWLGPTLSGWGALHGAWCVQASAPLPSQLSHYAWLATQHCPYCYMGAAFIAGGFWRLSPLRSATNHRLRQRDPARIHK
jgi:hypothetical protein